MASETMETLNAASTFHENGELEETEIHFTTGEQLDCQSGDNEQLERGAFIWPNGSKYDGEFLKNLRHGKGTQVWSDGSTYTGGFINDLRQGEGSICWPNGESYEGTFFKDRRHGKGIYKWPDGSSYSGTFYLDMKQGYGTFHFSSGDVFQGLYLEDEREGPGVMTYTNGKQDVGLWRGEKLIKLCSEIKGAFTIKSHPQFEFKPEDNIFYIDMKETDQTLDPVWEILNPPSVLDYPPKPDLKHRMSELFGDGLHPKSLAIDRHTFDKEFFKNVPQDTGEADRVVAWNATPDMVALQKHVLKHSFGKSDLKVSVDDILKLDRSKFGECGPLEEQSQELLLAASAGDFGKVEMLVNSGKVHPDVSDCTGHTALIGAAVNWHINVINILLNSGADVNKVNDEGCSALTAAAVFYYPTENFIYNIAERYMEPPQDNMAEELQQELQTGNNLTNRRDRKVSQINAANRNKSEAYEINRKNLESKQINRKRLDSKQINRKQSNSGLSALSGDMTSITMVERKLQSESQITTSSAVVDKSASETITEANLDHFKDADADSAYGDDPEGGEWGLAEEDDPEDFESTKSLRNFHIDVTDQLIERCATQLSRNEMVVSHEGSHTSDVGKARRLAVLMFQREKMKDTLNLLLRRGADPNVSSLPLPALFLAVKSADVDMVRLLLMKGADANIRMKREKEGLSPLHIACALPGDLGIQITELLLHALADPNARAEEDDSFLNHFLEEDWSKDVIPEASKALLGGRTALQIACSRDDNYKDACSIVRLLMDHKADTSLMCNGFSPLSLAIASGNDLAVDELITFGADPSLPLTHGLGNALCVAANTQYEHQRTLSGRLQLIEKLVRAGGDILAPVAVGPKRMMGTVVDYLHHVYNQDRRIAHVPYHALTHAERETYNAHRQLLACVGDIARLKAVEREKRRNTEEERYGMRSQSPSANFVYIGAGAKVPPGTKPKSASKAGHSQVKFESPNRGEGERSGLVFVDGMDAENGQRLPRDQRKLPVRKPLLKYCYECARSVGVRLTACTRCKEVFYCSNACKLKAWNTRHKDECIRVTARSRSPSAKSKTEVPRSATIANRAKSKTEASRSATIANMGKSKTEVPSSATIANRGKDNKGSQNNAQLKGLSKDREDGKKQGSHKFRTGSPPNYEYVYVDNYSHN